MAATARTTLCMKPEIKRRLQKMAADNGTDLSTLLNLAAAQMANTGRLEVTLEQEDDFFSPEQVRELDEYARKMKSGEVETVGPVDADEFIRTLRAA